MPLIFLFTLSTVYLKPQNFLVDTSWWWCQPSSCPCCCLHPIQLTYIFLWPFSGPLAYSQV